MPAHCLVTALGDEPLPPLVLARQLGAERVICVGRPAVQWRVPALLELLRREGCQVSWLPLREADVPASLAVLQRQVPDQPDLSIIFDLTNAHGVVGFALYELARQREQSRPDKSQVVRVDWSDRLIRSISPDRADSRPIQVVIDLADFLELHGKRLLGVERARGSASAFGQAARRIAEDLPAARPILEASHHGSWERPLRIRPQQGTLELARVLTGEGVLARRGNAFQATDLRAFQFLHGRWLEEYVFEIADGSGRFDDCASGLRFAWAENDGLANEIDFAGTARGRATIASCKTGFREAAGPLYELMTLAERAAGRSVIPVFVTSEDLDRPARHRAAALGIRVVEAEQLPDAASVLTVLLDDQTDGRAAGAAQRRRGGQHGRR
jgi:hypothetical protein